METLGRVLVLQDPMLALSFPDFEVSQQEVSNRHYTNNFHTPQTASHNLPKYKSYL